MLALGEFLVLVGTISDADANAAASPEAKLSVPLSRYLTVTSPSAALPEALSLVMLRDHLTEPAPMSNEVPANSPDDLAEWKVKACSMRVSLSTCAAYT